MLVYQRVPYETNPDLCVITFADDLTEYRRLSVMLALLSTELARSTRLCTFKEHVLMKVRAWAVPKTLKFWV